MLVFLFVKYAGSAFAIAACFTAQFHAAPDIEVDYGFGTGIAALLQFEIGSFIEIFAGGNAGLAL